MWASAALVTAGLAGGAILGTTMSAGAATTTSSSSSAAATSPAAPGTNGTAPAAPTGQAPPDGRHCPGLPKSGTVTAVGSNTVTIDGTTYSVTSNSDIDKNGEAKLSDLAVGDKVTFGTVAGASTPTIDRLHAGNEALDRPAGPPPGAPGGPGQSGTGSSSSSGTTGT
ncbi:MAG TPA: hypothetical protein VFH50_14135 [Acidimicrobiales bacterium]|nr:hypothetical protein [Acidimicrobiales bacterium]